MSYFSSKIPSGQSKTNRLQIRHEVIRDLFMSSGNFHQWTKNKSATQKNRYTTQFLHTAPKSTVNASIMPCQQNCDVHRLNLELKVIKTDKIKTLTELYQVTNELGRDNPHRRNEVTRSKFEIERKLMTTIAERLYIEDEISRGCPACRLN